MKLTDFVAAHNCVLMTPADNPAIQSFYNNISMTSEKFSVHTKKMPDYFRFLSYAADKHYVFGYPNHNGELEGMVSLIVRPCYINGKEDRVGHFLDLRFKPKRDRTVSGDWKDLGLGFTRTGRDLDELEGCRIFHGSYITTNIYATAAIGKDQKSAGKKTKPPSGKKEPPAREKSSTASIPDMFLVSNLATYRSVNIYARKPHKVLGVKKSGKSGEKLIVSRGTAEDRKPLKDFLDRQSRIKTFGYVYTGPSGELDRRLANWDGFSMSSFFIARSPAGKILGTFGAFDPGRGRQLFIDAIPPDKALLAKLGSMVGLKVPRPGETIDMLYLTSLELDKDLTAAQRLHVFDKLLSSLYKSGLPKNYHIVSFCDYSKQSLLEVVDGQYMYDTTPVLLYQLHAPEGTEIYREADMSLPPGHEMVLM